MNVSVSCAYTQGKREQFSGFNRTLDAINNVFRKFSAFHDETGRLNVDGMNIISNDGSNKLNRSRKARVSYKVQRTINASLNAATSTRAVSSNPNFVTRNTVGMGDAGIKSAIQGSNVPNPDEAVPSFVSGAMAKAGKGLLEGTLQAGTSAVSDKLLDLVGLGGKSAADKGK